MPRLFTLIACLCLCFSRVSGQEITWNIHGELATEVLPLLPENLSDHTLDEVIALMHTQGYLLVRVMHTDSTEVTLYPGERYRWARLSAGNLSETMISRTGFRPGRYTMAPVNQNQLTRLYERILDESESTGFPFASVGLDSIMIIDGTVAAGLRYTPGPQIVYDSIRIHGSSNVKRSWLQAYLGIPVGDPYNQQNINRIEARLDRLPFLRQTAPVSVNFVQGRAVIDIQAEHVPSNRIDGVIGFLPNEEEGLRITGEAELSLNNLFNSGKSFDLFWQRIKPETQYLEIKYVHTNLLLSPLDLTVGFDLLKEDTTFVNREFGLSADYNAGRHTLYFVSRFKSSRLLETSSYQDAGALPEVADFNYNNYGMGYAFSDIKPGWLGHYGIAAGLRGSLGNKKIIENPGLPDELYAGVDLTSLQGSIDGQVRWGFRIGRKSMLYQAWHGGWIQGKNLFLNDLYRLGGFRTIRGFNENQFYARQFVRLNLEWQFYVGESSDFFIFLDQAWLQTLSSSDNPTGIGVGTSLQTGNGLLQLAFAVGRSEASGFNFSNAKFHFGYVARF